MFLAPGGGRRGRLRFPAFCAQPHRERALLPGLEKGSGGAGGGVPEAAFPDSSTPAAAAAFRTGRRRCSDELKKKRFLGVSFSHPRTGLLLVK